MPSIGGQCPAFDPNFITEEERRVYDSWAARDEGSTEQVGRIARMSVGFIRDMRSGGWDEDEIRDELMGRLQDQATRNNMPANRDRNPPRGEFILMVKAAIRWALEATSGDAPGTARDDEPEDHPC